MDSSDRRASILMRKMEQTFTDDNIVMLTLSVLYPKVMLCCHPYAQKTINDQIQNQVQEFLTYVSGELYQQAIADYKQSQESGFPFHPYEAVLQYEISYNRHCHLSLYRDQYTFTGGAHGNTIRKSDTWNIRSGRSVDLSEFFPIGEDYQRFLINQGIKQAGENPEIFFEDYKSLISQSFNEEHYYLTSTGIAIYFQQYDIAPYSTGIVVFRIPYKIPPSCCRR